jgi:peptidoglycan/xylan/chitin deacetylase (PgdA/CDA1 family)
MEINRRDFLRGAVYGSLAAALGSPALGQLQGEPSPMAKNLVMTIDAGFSYDLTLAAPDDVPVGARWQGGALQEGPASAVAAALPKGGPLSIMYRPRLILKVDDLSQNTLRGFQRIAAMADRFHTKATFGINPSNGGADYWAFVNSLDRDRFEIWNHTFDHGAKGARQYGQPYDVQYANIELGHELVKKETGIVMRMFGSAGGVRFGDRRVTDGDLVTYYVIRNHPDYVGLFGGPTPDRAQARINAEGVFVSSSLGPFENEGFIPVEQRNANGVPDPAFVASWRERYPNENHRFVYAVGNSDELIWRLEHPMRSAPGGGTLDSAHIQIHPYAWNTDEIIDAMGRMLQYADGHGWRVSTAYETYRWLHDRGILAVEKTAPNRYSVDARRLHHSHQIEVAVPDTTAVEKHAYQITRGE